MCKYMYMCIYLEQLIFSIKSEKICKFLSDNFFILYEICKYYLLKYLQQPTFSC